MIHLENKPQVNFRIHLFSREEELKESIHINLRKLLACSVQFWRAGRRKVRNSRKTTRNTKQTCTRRGERLSLRFVACVLYVCCSFSSLGPCSDPGIPSNGGRHGDQENFFSYMTLHFFCNEGYQLRGYSILICTQDSQSDMVWSGALPTCESKLHSDCCGKLSWHQVKLRNRLLDVTCPDRSFPLLFLSICVRLLAWRRRRRRTKSKRE